LRFENENASDSILFNDDGDSNEIDESDSQNCKQCDPRILMKCGITIWVPTLNP
jgi:DNA-directed RNA polymerase subunit RPC12/RpoP